MSGIIMSGINGSQSYPTDAHSEDYLTDAHSEEKEIRQLYPRLTEQCYNGQAWNYSALIPNIIFYETASEHLKKQSLNFVQYKNFEKMNKDTEIFNKSNRIINWPEVLIYPVRTNTIKNFCKDFFLPGFVNNALSDVKIYFSLKNIFIKIVELIYDIITFPLRLITVIFRCYYNATNATKANPGYQILKDRWKIKLEDLQEGYIFLKTIAVNNDTFRCSINTFSFLPIPMSEIRRNFYQDSNFELSYSKKPKDKMQQLCLFRLIESKDDIPILAEAESVQSPFLITS